MKSYDLAQTVKASTRITESSAERAARSSRLTQKSVTVFLHHQDQYLFVKRAAHKYTDAGLFNGTGGKLDPGENFLECAVRETEEETGYLVKPEDCSLVGVINLTGGYAEDWVMCFFVIEVPTLEIPIGHNPDEGEFHWLSSEQIESGEFPIVDDLKYSWQHIHQRQLFFMSAELNDDEKIVSHSLTLLLDA